MRSTSSQTDRLRSPASRSRSDEGRGLVLYSRQRPAPNVDGDQRLVRRHVDRSDGDLASARLRAGRAAGSGPLRSDALRGHRAAHRDLGLDHAVRRLAPVFGCAHDDRRATAATGRRLPHPLRDHAFASTDRLPGIEQPRPAYARRARHRVPVRARARRVRIVVDVSPLSHPRTGVGNYIRGSLLGLAESGGHDSSRSRRRAGTVAMRSRRRSRGSRSSTSFRFFPRRMQPAPCGAGSAVRQRSGCSGRSTSSTSVTGCTRRSVRAPLDDDPRPRPAPPPGVGARADAADARCEVRARCPLV